MSDEFFGYEDQEPKNNVVAFLLVSSSIVLVVLFGLFAWFFGIVNDREVNKKLTQGNYVDLNNLRKEEDAKMNSYQFMDASKTTVRMPIEKAMQMVVEEAKATNPKPEAAPEMGHGAMAMPKTETKAEAKPEAKTEAKPAAKPAAKSAKAAEAPKAN